MPCLIYFTAKDRNEARKISKALVKEKLAACANFFSVESVYRWKGKIWEEKEYGVLLKTEKGLFNKIVKRIRELHSYQLPDIQMINSKTYSDIEKWIKETVKS